MVEGRRKDGEKHEWICASVFYLFLENVYLLIRTSLTLVSHLPYLAFRLNRLTITTGNQQ
jgi:hypothetical protein